jgi:hypothetical protein
VENKRRTLLIGGVALVKGRVPNAGPVMVEICDELEPVLCEGCYTRNAPFETVSLILRFGTRRCFIPEYRPVDKSHKELPVSVELEMEALRRMNPAELKREFTVATLEALIHAGHKFNLPTEMLEQSLRELPSVDPCERRRNDDF